MPSSMHRSRFGNWFYIVGQHYHVIKIPITATDLIIQLNINGVLIRKIICSDMLIHIRI